ncbi:hypothetical protein GMLC_26740 [Geomonas limicola]|uniref:Hemerythrin-like domain-containing protein n=1 Tax=Geomonas limicola TaxID=2740186 RepID=A0A6V8N928_9BACT|nr:bacteriohemerythrin [Geomonas limicola]GFO69095.1 hypothetical protein GMLC_26740 [Geomonas limicola]
MPIIEWNAGFMLGIGEIDQHHKQLVQLLNDTYDEFRAGARIGLPVIEQLIDHAERIFTLEEQLMREVCYPQLGEHLNEHEGFTSRIGGFKANYTNSEGTSIELLWFLCNWVTHHLRETDAELAQFIEVHKIQKRLRKPVQPRR